MHKSNRESAHALMMAHRSAPTQGAVTSTVYHPSSTEASEKLIHKLLARDEFRSAWKMVVL